jgi:aminoglycoside 6'-N-acetyltransferase
MHFDFTPIRRADFGLLSGWLSTPHVMRWWADDPSLAAIEADYGGCIDGTEAAAVFIAHYGGEAVGLIQRYRIDGDPEYLAELASVVQVPAGAISIDYLVGPSHVLGRGIGSAMIAAFVRRTWRDDLDTPAVVVPVQADNRASWRALERAGFTRIAQGELAPDNPVDGTRHYIYSLVRP